MRVTRREIAKKAGVSVKRIGDLRRKENWQSCGARRGKYKSAEEFETESLPDKYKALFINSGVQDVTDGERTPPSLPSVTSSSDQERFWGLLPDQHAPVQQPTDSAPAQPLNPIFESAVPLAQLTSKEIVSTITGGVSSHINDIPITAIPEKAKHLALARMDLLRIWDNFRSSFDSCAVGDDEFERWYQTGNGVPHLHNVLGKIGVEALKKWKRSLAGSSDWRNLVPHYKWSGMVLQTSLDIEVRRIFERFLLDPRRIKISQCIFYTREALRCQGAECDASDSVFYRYAEWYQKTHNDVWTFRREGNKALMDKVLLYIKRDAGMLKVGQVLVADGHRLNFQIVNPFTGKPCRATMIAYLDWKSYDLAGYEIMIEENTQCIASALRHAMMKLGDKPDFAYQDNGKAFRSKYFTNCPSFEESGFFGLFARFDIIPVFSLPYNARAKVIERWWGIFSESFERLMPSYIGASIADKPAYLLRNEKFHRALRGEYTPTIWEAVELIDQWLALWSSKTECPHLPGKSIRQVFDEGKGQGVDRDELDELMMDTKITKIYQNGIRIWGEYYWHESLYGKKFDDVTIRYSIFDKSQVRVYARNGALICTAARNQEMNPLVNYLGTEAEKECFKNVIEMRGRLRKGTIHIAKQIEEAPMPIAVNATALPRFDGPQPGALMMQQVQEARTIEDLRGEVDPSQFMPEEIEEKKGKKLFLWEYERESSLQAETEDIPEQEKSASGLRELEIISLKNGPEERKASSAGTHFLSKQQPIKQPTAQEGKSSHESSMRVIRAGILEVDLDRWTVKAGNIALDGLLPQEFRLLAILIASRGRIFSREELLPAISKSSSDVTTVNVCFCRLKRRLKKVGCERYLLSRRRCGFFFNEADL